MSDPAIKPEKDFSKEADKQIADSEQLAKVCVSDAQAGYSQTTHN